MQISYNKLFIIKYLIFLTMVDYNYLQQEYVKCYKDKSRTYMIEHYLKTYDETQKKEVPFCLFPRQKDLIVELGKGSNVVTTKPRQAGITTTCAAYMACEMVFADPDAPQVVLCIGNTLDLAQLFLYKVRDFLLQFPLWLWADLHFDDSIDLSLPPANKNLIFTVCNSKELRLKNGCRVIARSSGPNASRGCSGVSRLLFDEASFIENGQDVYTSALPTVSTGGQIIMVSTPNGKDQLYYETCRRAKLKGTADWNNFELVEMKWYQDPRYNKHLEWTRKNEATGEVEIITEQCLDDKGNVRYEPEKWAKLDADGWKPRSPWYIKMCRQFNNDSQKISQELDVSFLGSASNVVEPEFIEMQKNLNQREPIGTDPMEENTWIWKPPMEGHRYLMSIDASRGDAADRTALEIIDMDGIDEKTGETIMEQVLEYHGKKTGDVVGEMAYMYGRQYGNAFCVVDCVGGTGDACILTLRNLGYKNLYYDDPDMKNYMIQREVSSLRADVDGRLPGFHTNAVRYQMLTAFANLVKTNQFKIRSKRVLAELDTWIYKGKEGRIDHQDGAHDDTLTCLAMGLWVMNTNLKKIEANKNRDIMMMKAWVTANNPESKYNSQIIVTKDYNERKKNYPLPFFSTRNVPQKRMSVFDDYSWLF